MGLTKAAKAKVAAIDQKVASTEMLACKVERLASEAKQ